MQNLPVVLSQLVLSGSGTGGLQVKVAGLQVFVVQGSPS
jgi:hypothetical protein